MYFQLKNWKNPIQSGWDNKKILDHIIGSLEVVLPQSCWPDNSTMSTRISIGLLLSQLPFVTWGQVPSSLQDNCLWWPELNAQLFTSCKKKKFLPHQSLWRLLGTTWGPCCVSQVLTRNMWHLQIWWFKVAVISELFMKKWAECRQIPSRSAEPQG